MGVGQTEVAGQEGLLSLQHLVTLDVGVAQKVLREGGHSLVAVLEDEFLIGVSLSLLTLRAGPSILGRSILVLVLTLALRRR